jgi:hypothetical protein
VKRAAAENRDWLFVLAVADPVRAMALVERKLDALEESDQATLSRSGLVELGSILTARNRLEMLSTFGSTFREVREED